MTTSQSIVHLRNKHSTDPFGYLDNPPQSIKPHLTPISMPQTNPKQLAAEIFIDNFINRVVKEDITFSQASSNCLRQLIVTSGPQIANLIPSANTVGAWIIKACNKQREEVKDSLNKAQSRISLS